MSPPPEQLRGVLPPLTDHGEVHGADTGHVADGQRDVLDVLVDLYSPAEPDPAPDGYIAPVVPLYHRSRRRRVLGLALLMVVLVATTLIVETVVRTTQKTFPAFVGADNVTVLDFPDVGTVGRILVAPGARVRPGQVLATEAGAPALQAVVADDRSAVTADRAGLAQLQAVEASVESGPAAGAAVTAAQQQLGSAQAGMQSAAAQSAGRVATARATQQSDAQRLAGARTAAATACSVPAPGAAAGSAATSNACTVARGVVRADQAAVKVAVAAVATARTAGRTAAGQAGASVKTAEQALTAAQQAADTVADSPAGAQVAAAQAALSRDEAALARDQATAGGATLRAPAAGTVTAVNGTVGAPVGPTGVRQLSLQSAATQAAPSFSLSPAASTGASGSSGAVDQPVIELSEGTARDIVVQVPENRLGRVPAGSTASVSIPTLGLHDAPAHFVRMDSGPQVVDGSIVFDVVFALDRRPPAGMLPGLTADVTVSRPKR